MRFIKQILRPISNYFATGQDKPLLENKERIARIYEKKRRLVFSSIVFGYSFFYVCRLSFSVAKKPMIDGGILNAAQMGKIGFALLIAYAFGKLINGFLADRSNIRRFMSTGLLVSAVINILFGFTDLFMIFVILWFFNGWFQSMGAAPSAVAMSQWFSNRERGTRYGLWSAAHSIGEGLTFVGTAVVIEYYGWRWGIRGAGAITILVAMLIFKTLCDRPQTYGLPSVADYKNDHAMESKGAKFSIGLAQLEVLKNPYVWIIGLASASMYISRYGINNWGVLYLQEAKNYTLISAGAILGWAKIMETAGAVSSGFVSDFLFKARRNVVTLMYGSLEVIGLIILFMGPSTHLFSLDSSYKQHLNDSKINSEVTKAFEDHNIALPEGACLSCKEKEDKQIWQIKYDKWYFWWRGYNIEQVGTQLYIAAKYNAWHILGLSLFGFGLGGLLVFLGGLIAIDISSKKASGAAAGLVGMFSYIGAAIQDWVSGSLIEVGKMTVNGQTVHDFDNAFYIWLGAAILAVVLASVLWNVRAKE